MEKTFAGLPLTVVGGLAPGASVVPRLV